jgi:hypothetical protein
VEICGTTRDFGLKTPFVFSLVDSIWEPCMTYSGMLEEEPVSVSYIRVPTDMQNLEIHLRCKEAGGVEFSNVAFEGIEIADINFRMRPSLSSQTGTQLPNTIRTIGLFCAVRKESLTPNDARQVRRFQCR